MPFFSVVIPCYNRADLIGATLDSVLGQSMDDLEIIVVDDGSTDGSLALLRRYAEQWPARLTIIEQQNAGPGAARNRGMEQARGQYVAFLDSDDLWLEWTAALYRHVLEREDCPAFLAGLPHATPDPLGHKRNADATDWREQVRFDSFPDYLASAQNWRCWVSASAFVVRRDVLQNSDIAFSTLPINAEDIDFTLQLGTAPGFVCVTAPSSFAYRRHDQSLVTDNLRNLQGIRNLLMGERSGRYPGGAARARDRQLLLGKHIRPACLNYRKTGHHRAASELYRATLSWNIAQKRARFLLGFWLARAASRTKDLEERKTTEATNSI